MRVFELLDHLRIQGIKFESVKINYRRMLHEFKGIANPRKDKFKNFISEVNDSIKKYLMPRLEIGKSEEL